VDFNPDVISMLNKQKIPSLYGDVYDADLLEELPLEKVKIAVSTIPDFETNLTLIETIRSQNKKAVIIVRAHEIDNALELYQRGADYVLTPHFLGGEYVANMIKEFRSSKKDYEKEKEKHIKILKERKGLKQEHPDVEKN